MALDGYANMIHMDEEIFDVSYLEYNISVQRITNWLFGWYLLQ